MLEHLRPAYAETHYKFRLPWSPLFRPLPEMLVDAPFQVVAGQNLVAWLVVRDADLFPVMINEVRIRAVFPGEAPYELVFPLQMKLCDAFHFIPLNLESLRGRGLCQIQAKVRGSNHQGKKWEFCNNNLPGLKKQDLEVGFLEHPLPIPDGWSAGETHCHSYHSSDPVEFGAQPAVLQQAARICGLDWVLCTDHSYDFSYRNDNYRLLADPKLRWESYCKEMDQLSSYPCMIAGEEVSCGSKQGKNLHLLVPGHQHYIPGDGDGGRRWLRNRPNLSVTQVLAEARPLPCFAAHPLAPLGKLESWIFRRSIWREEDLNLEGDCPVRGLQFWNGTRADLGFRRGRAWWISLLLCGHKLYPLAGNDAHGDLNQCTGVAIPLFSLKSHRRHVFGKARTVLPCSPKKQDIQAALVQGNLYCTDGPALHFTKEHSLKLMASSTPDQGHLLEIRLFRGIIGENREREELYSLSKGTLQWTQNLEKPPPGTYLRAECTTQFGSAALTSAVFGE